MEVVEPNERVRTAGEFVTQVAMAFGLFVCAWWAYGKITPLIFDDSVPLPLRFAEEPTVDDHLPDNFVSPSTFDLAQSRFVTETPAGFRYWLLASTEETGIVCLFVRLRDGSGALDCQPLETFAAQGLVVSFEESTAPDGPPMIGAARYLAEGMDVEGDASTATAIDRFAFVEGETPSTEPQVDVFVSVTITGGADLPESDEAEAE